MRCSQTNIFYTQFGMRLNFSLGKMCKKNSKKKTKTESIQNLPFELTLHLPLPLALALFLL